MQRQTIKEWVHQLKTEPGLKAEDYRMYLIRDPAPVDASFEGGTVFYVGQSVDPSYRLWEHFGGSVQGPSLIGTFICENAPESGAWLFEQYTVEDCWPFVQQHRMTLSEELQAFYARASHGFGVNEAEQALIKLHRPYFNAAHNPDPRPLPAYYKSSYRDRPAENPYADELAAYFGIE